MARVLIDAPSRGSLWCDIIGVQSNKKFVPAHAQPVEDSSDGSAWLIFGGDCGVRFKPSPEAPWDLSDPAQWGRPFLVFDSSGAAIEFAKETASPSPQKQG